MDIFPDPAVYIQTTRALMIIASILGLPAAGILLMSMPCINLGNDLQSSKNKRAILGGVLLLLVGKILTESRWVLQTEQKKKKQTQLNILQTSKLWPDPTSPQMLPGFRAEDVRYDCFSSQGGNTHGGPQAREPLPFRPHHIPVTHLHSSTPSFFWRHILSLAAQITVIINIWRSSIFPGLLSWKRTELQHLHLCCILSTAQHLHKQKLLSVRTELPLWLVFFLETPLWKSEIFFLHCFFCFFHTSHVAHFSYGT